MGESLPRMPINRRAKFDAASFIHGGEIRNRTNTQNYKQTNTSVFGETAVYPHMPTAEGNSIADRRQSSPLTASAQSEGDWRLSAFGNRLLAAARRFVGFSASGRAKFPKMGHSMPRTPMNHRAKFDAASFIPGGEICNRTK